VQQRLGRVEGFVRAREMMHGRLREFIRRIVVGKDEAVDLCLISLLARGHDLATDIPGVRKTNLARAISTGAIEAGRRPTANLRVGSLAAPVPSSLRRFGEAF
jgi:hypothetical protein